MLKCCNKKVQILESINLFDTATQTHRVLTVGRCRNEKCGTLRAQIVYFDVKKMRFVYENIKKKDVIETIKKYKNEPYLSNVKMDIKHGSRQNMGWHYGVGKVTKDGTQINYRVDFNGTKEEIGRKENVKSINK